MLTNIKVIAGPIETYSLADKAKFFEAEMMSLAWTRCMRGDTNSEIRFSLEGCSDRQLILEGNRYFFKVSRLPNREFSEKVLILTFDDHRFYWSGASYDHCLGHFMSGGIAAQRIVVQELDYMENMRLGALVNQHKADLENELRKVSHYAVSFPHEKKIKCVSILRDSLGISLTDAIYMVVYGNCVLPGITEGAVEELRRLGASIKEPGST